MSRLSLSAALVVLVSLAMAGPAPAQTVELAPIMDATLYEDAGGVLANGSGSYLFVGRTAQPLTRRALDHLSLTIRHGEAIGIAGRSGSGKSTWIKVLLRLVHPQAGQIALCGRPLSEVSRMELAHLMSYVGQNPFVFSGTMCENIAYGNGEVSLAAVQRAAELVNLHDEILQMPGGYHAAVTERGQNLSGGQRQRVAIARVLLKNAPILILDEATSALDNISERCVQDALGIKDADRTTIIIAHRLTTLKHCDRILVFEDGRISALGSYDELVAQDGLFAQLVRSADAVPGSTGSHNCTRAPAG